MSRLQLPPLTLYIHIPWCERKCPYCDFNSHTAPENLPEIPYISALLEDLELDLPFVQDREIQSIFIGGGTPSLLSVDAYQALFNGIRERTTLARDAEVTLEANPGSAEADKFAGFVEAGVTRISLGIQSLDNDLLHRLGRIHDRQQALAAVDIVSSCQLDSYNIDLMHGLPQQNVAGARADLEMALGLQPPHLSWYQLTIEPNTHFYSDRPELPNESILGGIQDEGESMLAAAGFDNYEVSAWAQPGHQCSHNRNYWQFGDYIGIGAGAHGKVSNLSTSQVQRSSRKKQPVEYLQSSATERRSSRVLNDDDLCGEYMLNVLRLREGFLTAEFSSHTGLPWSLVESTVLKLTERGLLDGESERIKASLLGRQYLDSVIAEFF